MLRPERIREFRRLLGERVLVLDGAMGTVIQSYRLGEADYRGERFRGQSAGPQGQQRPAGADAAGSDRRDPPPLPRGRRRHHRDQHVQLQRDVAGRLRPGSAGARAEPDGGADRAPRGRRCGGSARAGRASSPAPSGPTNRTASLSPKVSDPGFRNVTFDELVGDLRGGDARAGRGRRRPDPGRDHLRHAQRQGRAVRRARRCSTSRASTCRSWSPARSPTRRVARCRDRRSRRSGTRCGTRDPSVIGLNCALGAKQLRPYVEELSRIADAYVCAYPNAGLPNAFGEYDETACETADLVREYADERASSTSSAAAAARRPSTSGTSPSPSRACRRAGRRCSSRAAA